MEYLASYKNINIIAKGKYISNKKFQNSLFKFVKFYININKKKTSKKIDNFNEFSSFKQNSQNELYIEQNISNIYENSKKEFNNNSMSKSDNYNNKSKTIKKSSSNEFSKGIEFNSFSSNINIDKNNKIKINKFNNIGKISKVFSNEIYYDEEEQIINNKNIINNSLNTSILKYKSNKIKKYKVDNNNDNNKNIDKNKNEKNNNNIINFNFHISDNNIILKNQKNDVIQKINDKIKKENNINNSINNAINSNSNNIINETNYNFTKNYCIIY